MSRIRPAEAGEAVLAVGLGGMRGADMRGSFRALYADGQDVRPRRASSPEPRHEAPVDPVEQARAQAFALGFDEGSRVTAEALAADQEARQRLADALEQFSPAASGTLSTMLSAAVIGLVSQIVGEVDIDVDLLRQRCETIAAFIDEGEGRGALHLHPDDVPLVEGMAIAVPVVADAGLKRGCVRLDTADGWIEDGPDVRLSRLRAMLDDMEGRA